MTRIVHHPTRDPYHEGKFRELSPHLQCVCGQNEFVLGRLTCVLCDGRHGDHITWLSEEDRQDYLEGLEHAQAER